MTDFNFDVELDTIDDVGEITNGIPSKDFRIPSLKKDPDFDVAADTSFLGAGATETIVLFESSSDEFKKLNPNSQPTFSLQNAIPPIFCNPGCSSKRVQELKFSAPNIQTDCGDNSTGIPIYTIAGGGSNQNTMKVPVAISGNWTPQTKRGYILLNKKPTDPKLKVTAYSYTVSTECNPLGLGTTGLHILNFEQLKGIFCVNNMRPTGYFDQNGLGITAFTHGDGANYSGMIFQDTDPSCVPSPDSWFVVFSNTAQQTFTDLVSAIAFSYTRSDGRTGSFIFSTKPVPGAIIGNIEGSGDAQVLDLQFPLSNLFCDRQHSKWAYPPDVLPVTYGSGLRSGTSGEAACTGTASIVGNAFGGSGSIPVGAANYYIPLFDQFPFDETGSFSLTVSHNGVSISASGTVHVSRACGNDYIAISFDGAFTGGSLAASAVQDPAPSCTTTIAAAYQNADGQIGDWSPVLQINLPISNRSLQIDARLSGNAFGYKFSFYYLSMAHVDGEVAIRVRFVE